MVNSRFRDTTKPKTLESGISKPNPGGPARVDQLPQVLKYPTLLPDLINVKDIFSYILKHPGDDGLSVLIYRQPDNDQVIVICGDWHGIKLDLVVSSPIVDLASDFVTKEAVKFYEMMRVMGVDQAQFFFAVDDEGLLLYDVQLSLNKFAGPGMVGDVFGKIFRTPQTLKTEIIDERALEYIQKGTGAYEGDLLIKPSRFRMFHDPETNTYSPLYVEVRR
jgi:hypothetical protein